jgi:hypothetical protein
MQNVVHSSLRYVQFPAALSHRLLQAAWKGTKYALNTIFRSSMLTGMLCWKNTTGISKLLMPLPDGFVCRWISVVHSLKHPSHKNRLQFSHPEHALYFHLQSLHRTEDTHHMTQEQCCVIKHMQQHGVNLLTETLWHKLHFCVKCCYVSLLVNKIQPLKIPESVTRHPEHGAIGLVVDYTTTPLITAQPKQQMVTSLLSPGLPPHKQHGSRPAYRCSMKSPLDLHFWIMILWKSTTELEIPGQVLYPELG